MNVVDIATFLCFSLTQSLDQRQSRAKMKPRRSMDHHVVLSGNAPQMLRVVQVSKDGRLDALSRKNLCLILLSDQRCDGR